MAPSTRLCAAQHHHRGRAAPPQQTNFYSFAKVSKAQVGKNAAKTFSIKTLQALSDAVRSREKEAAQPRPVLVVAPSSSKLKRKCSDAVEAEEGATSSGPLETGNEQSQKSPISKKRAKRNGNAPLAAVPVVLQELRTIFQHFLRAFSLHRAHNGSGSPAELNSLLDTVTRLYKKRNVRREDVQRMLALFELPGRQHETATRANGGAILQHNKSPFRLVISGIGLGARHLVEYCSDMVYDEARLLDGLDEVIRNDISGGTTLEHYPLLAYTKGTQTMIRQEKASAARNYILNFGVRQDQGHASNVQSAGSMTEPDLSRLSISSPDTAMATATATAAPCPRSSTKNRTLSLFDRIKSKQNAALLQPSLSPPQLLYRHALSRIGDVVEILRMKQNQRTVLAASTCNKLTLSMSQAVSLVKGSLTVPLGEEEIRLCFKILAEDVEGDWLKLVEMGDFQSVVVQGRCSMRGDEVRNMLMKKDNMPK